MSGSGGAAGGGLNGLLQSDGGVEPGQSAGQPGLDQVLVLVEVDVELVEAGDLAALDRANGVVLQIDEDA